MHRFPGMPQNGNKRHERLDYPQYFDNDRDRDRYFMNREDRDHWEDRRSTDRFGQGQSGYTAGRYGEDRSLRETSENRNQGYAGIYGEPDRDDERWTGRGGDDYWQDRRERLHEPFGGRGSAGVHPGGQQGMPGYGQQTGYGYGQEGFAGRNREYTSAWSYDQRPVPVGGGHRGKGPQGYVRSDDRIREDVCDVLAEDDHVDATHIEVVVQNGDVFLTGTVEDRHQKRLAEVAIDRIPGVRDVQNQLRIRGNRPRPDAVGMNETETSDRKHRA